MKKSTLLTTVGLYMLTGVGTPNINANNIGYVKELMHNFDYGQKGDTKEIKNDIDVNNHEEIINTDVNTILESLGYEKGIEVINIHFMIELNRLRNRNNVPTLSKNDSLIKISQEQADYLDQLGYIKHTFGERELPKRIRSYGLEYHTCGENLADGQKDINTIIKDWLTSKSHKANLLNKNFKSIGLGYKNKKWVYTAIG